MSTEIATAPQAAAPDADRPRALVVEGDDKLRAVTCEVLRREKFEVFSCKEVGDILRLTKELVPAVLMLDVAIPEIDLRMIIGTLARCRETMPVMTIALCPPEYDETRTKALRGQGAFDVLHRPLKRAVIVDAAAAALKASEAERAKLDAASARRPALARVVDSNNSLLARQAICPFHEDPVPFTRYTLRTGKIVTESNFFDITVYKSAPSGVDFCNYHQLAAIVCPRCWFSSIDAAYFRDPMDPKSVGYIFNNSTWEAVRAEAVARRKIAADLPSSFYSERRSLAQALVSYDLAIACSKVLFEKNRRTMPIELARIGNYHLRIAHLKQLAGAAPELIDAHYRDAMGILQEAFTIADGPQIFKIAYQMAALGIYFGEDKSAHQYLQMMFRSQKDKDLPDDQKEGLARYLPRCQNIWSDRNLHRSPLYVPQAA